MLSEQARCQIGVMGSSGEVLDKSARQQMQKRSEQLGTAIASRGCVLITGATTGLVATVQGLNVSPLLILVGMNIVVLIMGCFMETIAIMMITLPIFMPIISRSKPEMTFP